MKKMFMLLCMSGFLAHGVMPTEFRHASSEVYCYELGLVLECVDEVNYPYLNKLYKTMGGTVSLQMLLDYINSEIDAQLSSEGRLDLDIVYGLVALIRELRVLHISDDPTQLILLGYLKRILDLDVSSDHTNFVQAVINEYICSVSK